jgi:hypothetical protein
MLLLNRARVHDHHRQLFTPADGRDGAQYVKSKKLYAVSDGRVFGKNFDANQ